MKTLTMIQLTNKEGIQIFYTDKSRVNITDLPKDKFDEAKQKLETKFKSPGIYFLFGQEVKSGTNIVYIGEADNLSKRLRQHMKDEKESWIERICLISSQLSSQEFSKTELHYIEKKLIKDFDIYSEYNLVNKNAGQGREPDALLKMKLLDDVELIENGLNILGYEIRKVTTTIKNSSEKLTEQRNDIEVYAKVVKSGLVIKGIIKHDNSIIIKKGQRFSATTINKNYNDKKVTSLMLDQLIKAKQIKNYGDKLNYDIEFLEDIKFNKPSPAAVLICGGTNNGWFVWRDANNKEYINYLRNKK